MTGNENPYFERFDEILDICREHDVTLSLGDACRPGCIADSTDDAQLTELIRLGRLTRRARERDVQVIIEGPGHMSLDDVAANMQLQRRLCDDAPFYVLGPIVTDIAPGYDHITAAIGGTVAAAAGRFSWAESEAGLSSTSCTTPTTSLTVSEPERSVSAWAKTKASLTLPRM